MNRRPMVLASLILCSTALLLLAVAESIPAKSANTQPVALNLYQPLLGGGIGTDSVWSIVPSPNPGGDNILGAVAVDSAGGIWAVGSSGSWALIIHSTDGGVSWTTYTTTIGTFAGLYGVTALSPSNVFAVGYYRATNGAEVTLALHYTGTWSVVPSASPAPSCIFYAVAASADGDVWAVGSKASMLLFEHPFAAHWNGQQFVEQGTGLSADYGVLRGVALTTANNVWAVGATRQQFNSASYTYAAQYDGTMWNARPTPLDPGNNNDLIAVTIDSQSDIRAVGFADIGGLHRPLFERRFHDPGGSWADPVVDQQFSTERVLYGVAASSTTDVWAVGQELLTEHYDGVSWEAVAAEGTGESIQDFYGVAADAAGGAWAVGSFESEERRKYTLVEH